MELRGLEKQVASAGAMQGSLHRPPERDQNCSCKAGKYWQIFPWEDFKDTIGRFLLAFLRAHPPSFFGRRRFFFSHPAKSTQLFCSSFDWQHCTQDGAPNSFCLDIFSHPNSANLTSKSGGWVSRARTTERKIGAVMVDLDTTWCSEWPQVRLLQTDGSNKRLMRRFAAARCISVQL